MSDALKAAKVAGIATGCLLAFGLAIIGCYVVLHALLGKVGFAVGVVVTVFFGLWIAAMMDLSDSGSGPEGENSRSEVEGEAPQSGDSEAGASPANRTQTTDIPADIIGGAAK